MKHLLTIILVITCLTNVKGQILDVGDTVNAQTLDGIRAYYPFNGNANDESANNNNGTVLGPTLTTDRFGNPNSAYKFNGTSDYIKVQDHTSLRPTDAVTVSAWVNAEDFTSWNIIVCKRYRHSSFPYNSYLLFASGSAGAAQKWSFGTTGTSTDKYVFSPNLIDTNKWVHIAGTYDKNINDSNIKLYVNGSLIDTDNANFTLAYTDSSLRIGMAIPGPSKQFFKGKIDDVRIYGRALCESEIKSFTDSIKIIRVGQSNVSICGSSSSEYIELIHPQPDIEYSLVDFSDSSLIGSSLKGNCNDSVIRFNIASLSKTTSFLIKAKNASSTKFLDSIFEIKVFPKYALTIDTLLCGNDSVFFNNIWIDTTSSTIGSFKTPDNCDSIITFNVIKQYPDVYYDTVSICNGDSIFLENNYQKNAATYYDTLPRSNACDSIIASTLVLLLPDTFNFKIFICENDSFFSQGEYQKQSGVYYDTIPRNNTCDSIRIINLNILLPDTFNFTFNLCENDSFFTQGNYQKQAGTYYDTITRSNTCDSIRIINLNFYKTDSTFKTFEICSGDSIQIISTYRNSAGIYTDTLKDSNNCDSIIISTLTILQPSFTTHNINICIGDSALASGSFQKTSGLYYDTLKNNNQCDSVIETNLTVKGFTSTNSGSFNICSGDSLLFRGDYFNTSGSYYDTVFANGCIDSIYSLILTINAPTPTSTNVSICRGGFYILGSDSIFSSGKYYDTLPSLNGCDSIVEINLTINGFINIADTLEYCSYDSILFQSIYYYRDTILYDTLSQSLGCDTLVTTTIRSIGQKLLLSDTINICNNDTTIDAGTYSEYLWSDGSNQRTFNISKEGIYWVTVKQNTCQYTDTINVIENCGPKIYFPTAFTPNNDGLNDKLILSYNNVVRVNYKLFNMWGELIFESNQVGFEWDGLYKGNFIPTGNYIWLCEYEGYNSSNRLIKERKNGSLTVYR